MSIRQDQRIVELMKERMELSKALKDVLELVEIEKVSRMYFHYEYRKDEEFAFEKTVALETVLGKAEELLRDYRLTLEISKKGMS